jgi:hypothetical protein
LDEKTMSDWASPTAAIASILTALIAASNVAFTAYVNNTFQERLERTKTALQIEVKQSEQRIDQVKAVTGIENNAYLNRLPELRSAIEKDLLFAESVTEGTVPEKSRDQSAELYRIQVRLLTAACEPRPDDAKLSAAATSLNTTVDLLRQSIIAGTIDEDYGTRMANVIDAWKTFQAEVYRVAAAGYGTSHPNS